MPKPERIYLDHAATTPLRDEVLQSMLPHLGPRPGNPSSLHAEGRNARTALEDAREAILRQLGRSAARLAFCGGGTEADAAAILGTVLAHLEDGRSPADLHLVASAVEHSAVHGALEQARLLGVAHDLVAVDGCGRVHPDDVIALLRPQTILVSIMGVNNEVGTIEPVVEIASVLADRGVPMHCDAIQMVGKVPMVDGLPGDLAVISAHKIGGPCGVAALVVRPGVPFRGLVRGGPQEDGMRGGTQAVAQAAGFARAVELAVKEFEQETSRLSALRDQLWSSLQARIDGLRLNTPTATAAPHILSVSFESVEGESLLRHLDDEGVAVSTGSACNVGASKPSRVLQAMGLSDEEVRGSLRFSLGRSNNESDMERALDALEKSVKRLRSIAPRRR